MPMAEAFNTMERDEALSLLKEGRISDWNRWRRTGVEIPDLFKADLSEANLSEANLSEPNLSEANLSEANLSEAKLSGANLTRANLTKAKLSGADLSEAKLSGANLSGTNLSEANLREANLGWAKLSGAKLSGADLSGADLSGADLSRADLSGADLRHAMLSGANLMMADFSGADLSRAALTAAALTKAKLSGAMLSGAMLSEASLSGADLSGADLSRADLSGADLRHAMLSGANLMMADFSGADLSRADLTAAVLTKAMLSGAMLSEAMLTRANLSEADLRRADLSEADLSDTILFRARIIRCQLANAVFENAEVTDCQVHETRGRPIPPGILRMSDGSTLTGEDARNFFNPPATVEVFLSSVLTDEEIGLYHFHLGEVQHRSVGTGVYLVGRRNEAEGAVLRFQAPTYEQIYQVIPVLLTPFRMSRAVDWVETLRKLPEQGRGLMLTELARIEAANPHGVWHFADRLAEGFGEFPNARVKQIRDGRNWAVRIDVANDPSMARLLNARPKASSSRYQQKNEFHLPGGIVRLSLEDRSMSQEIKAGGNVVAAAGEGIVQSTGDVVFQQVWNEVGGSIDLPRLADDLSKLRAEMKKEATEPEHDVATANVSMAEKAAKEGNGPKALEYLKAAGKWALDTATKLGIDVASDALTKAIGVGKS